MSRASRALGVLAAITALATAGVSARPAAATDIDSLRAQAQAVADEVSSLEHRLAGLESRQIRLKTKIEAAGAEISSYESDRMAAESAYRASMEDYVADAVEVYKGGDQSTNLALVLSAQDLNDLELFSKITAAAADRARDSLAQSQQRFEEASAAQDEIDRRKQDLLGKQEEVDALTEEIRASLAGRRDALGLLQKKVERLEAAARAAAVTSSVNPTGAFAAALSPTGPTSEIPEGLAGTGVTFEGTASWYGPGFEGNYTANGDVFDSSLFSAASKDLPLPSYLFVTHEGRSVVVLVNDRGPYVGDRILDLSHAAAEAIGISGLGWIEAEILVRN